MLQRAWYHQAFPKYQEHGGGHHGFKCSNMSLLFLFIFLVTIEANCLFMLMCVM